MASSLTRMLLVGDINDWQVVKHDDGLRRLLLKVVPELRQGQIVFANLEFALTDRGEWDPAMPWNSPEGGLNPDDVVALGEAGFNIVSVANNQVMAWGPEGMLQTLELLESQGIAHCGGGRNLSEAHKPAIIEKNGVRVAFLAYTSVFVPSYRAGKNRPGMSVVEIHPSFQLHPRTFDQPGTLPIVTTTPNKKDVAAMQEDVRLAKTKADLVVVSWHWGISEGYRKRVTYQTEMGRAAIDAGANIVVGHHPHLMQGVEIYKKGVIFYSLGNFAIWHRPAKVKDKLGRPPRVQDHDMVMVDCEVDKQGIRSLSLRPVLINEVDQPEILNGKDGTRILDALVKDSQEFGTVFVDKGDRLILELPA